MSGVTFNRILTSIRGAPGPVFAQGGLDRVAAIDGYGTAEPYPHAVLGDVFAAHALRAIVAEFPSPSAPDQERHDDGTLVAGKIGSTWRTRMGPTTRLVLSSLASPPFLLALEEATGIGGLIPDPYLFGGGLHATAVGGRLAVHADFNRHPRLRLDRRLNVLIYLNEGWKEANQGWLELWDDRMTQCVRRVLPVFNRMVVFSTSGVSFHGQPEPIVGPPGLFRRSIALYYYTTGRPEEANATGDHSTLWRERPGRGY